jgi:DNA-binding transcriptional ArsR family regulator
MLHRMAADVFRALADPTRREILKRLRRRPLTAGELADLFPQNRSTLSAHCSALRAADLVQTERQGQTIIYSLNLSVMEEAIARVLDALGAVRHTATQVPRAAPHRRGGVRP